MDDTKIVELFWQRDESAIKETDIKYSRYLTAISYNILKSDEDAEECHIWALEIAFPHKSPMCLERFWVHLSEIYL
ncbi:MAG: hypothetical protein RR414_01030 [Oscillospiraceae bacterium]